MDTQRNPAELLAERLGEAALGMVDLLSIHLGDRLGFYRELAESPSTPHELAAATGTEPRYVLEWCRQQAATGLLGVDHDRYHLAPGAAEVLVDEHHLLFSVPLARLLAGLAVHVPDLQRAYREGGGVSWGEFGSDVREAQAAANRPWFEQALDAALHADPRLAHRYDGAHRIGDIGCGTAWSSIALAQGRPDLRVTGFDVDEPSVLAARDNVAAAGLSDRVEVRLADAASLATFGPFDLVTAFECVHDLPHPVAVLDAARRSLTPGGAVLVVDEAVAADPAPVGDPVERMMYGWSILACLPDSMTHPGSAATGTVMRPATLARYAREAGFSDVVELDVEGFALFRFTLLLP